MSENEDEDPRSILAERIVDCYDDPDLFNSVILCRSDFFPHQFEWCERLVEYKALAIETGNMLGKDYWVAGIVLWWLWTRPGSLVFVTGPGQTSIGSVTWKEIRRAVDCCPFKELDHSRITSGVKTSPHVIELAPGHQALGFSTTTIERMSGQHAGELLVVVGEASGVEEEVWQAIDSLGATKLVAIGNPLRAEGGFVDLCNQASSDEARGVPKSEAVYHLNMPSTSSPHAEWDHSPVGLADRPWLEAMERKYGKDSLWFRCHILAVRPSLINEQLIPDADLDRCINDETRKAVAEIRIKWPAKAGRKRIGCDVGEGVGNARTVIFVRDDLAILDCHASRYTGPGDAAEQIVRLAFKHGVKEEDISYDGAGKVGKQLGNALYKRGFGRAHAYFGSTSGGKRCTNLRTACALALARRLDSDHYPGLGRFWDPFCIVPTSDWPAIREELLELRYHLEGDQSALEQKDEMMERLGRSPDFADALTQTFRQEAIEG